MRAGVPVIPIAVVGAEEAMPILFKSNRLAKALGVPYFPITANMLVFGPARARRCTFPRSSRSACCRRCTSTCRPNQERYSRSRVMEESERIRRMVQDALYDMLRTRRIGLVRVAPMRVLVTGLSTYWGGRSRRRSSAGPTSKSSSVSTPTTRASPLERTEFVRADSSHSILARIVRATQIDTVVHTHLIVDSTRASGRTLHEINVIGTMNLLAAAGAAGARCARSC